MHKDVKVPIPGCRFLAYGDKSFKASGLGIN